MCYCLAVVVVHSSSVPSPSLSSFVAVAAVVVIVYHSTYFEYHFYFCIFLLLSWWIETAISIARNRTLGECFRAVHIMISDFFANTSTLPAAAAKFSSVIIKNSMDSRALLCSGNLHRIHAICFCFYLHYIVVLYCAFVIIHLVAHVHNHHYRCRRLSFSRSVSYRQLRCMHRLNSSASNFTMYFIYLYLFLLRRACVRMCVHCPCSMQWGRFSVEYSRVRARALLCTISTLEFTMRRKKFHS